MWAFCMEKKEEQNVEKQEYFVWYNLVKMLAWKCGSKSFIALGGGGIFPFFLQNTVASIIFKRHALAFNIQQRPRSCKKVR